MISQCTLDMVEADQVFLLNIRLFVDQ